MTHFAIVLPSMSLAEAPPLSTCILAEVACSEAARDLDEVVKLLPRAKLEQLQLAECSLLLLLLEEMLRLPLMVLVEYDKLKPERHEVNPVTSCRGNRRGRVFRREEEEEEQDPAL